MVNFSFTAIAIVAALSASACTVSDSDPSLWAQTSDLGGKRFLIPIGSPADGAGGEMISGGPAGSTGAGGIASTAGGTTSTGSGGAIPSGGAGGLGAGAIGGTGAAGVGIGAGGAVAAGGTGPGAGGAAGGTGGSVSTNSGKCTFLFDVTTVTVGGRFTPNNAGAIWITDAQNKFVKTLSYWCPRYIVNVSPWVQSSGQNKVDAVSSATRHMHGPISAKWDCTDVSGAPVLDGKYTVRISFAEGDLPFTTVPQASLDFAKSAAGADVMGQDTANFKSMHATLTVP